MARVQDYIIGFIFIGMLSTAFSLFITTTYTSYGIEQGENYNNVYNNLSSLLGTAKGYSETLSESEQKGEKAEVALGFTLFTALDIITFPFRAIPVMQEVISIVAIEIGIDKWVIDGVIAIVIVVLVFLIANAMFSRGNI